MDNCNVVIRVEQPSIDSFDIQWFEEKFESIDKAAWNLSFESETKNE